MKEFVCKGKHIDISIKHLMDGALMGFTISESIKTKIIYHDNKRMVFLHKIMCVFV